MSGVVNGYAVNGAALASWVKGATVAATLAATVYACDATLFHGAQVAAPAAATVTAQAIKSRPATAAKSAVAHGYLLPLHRHAGAATATARCTSLAYTLREVVAGAGATAGATGYALAASDVGEAAFTAEIVGSGTPLRTRPGVATLVGSATSAVSGVVFGGRALPAGAALARAEAGVQLTGEGFTRHDGYVEQVLGTAAATVGAGYLERWVALGGATALSATPGRARPGAVLFDGTGTAVVITGVVWPADVTSGAGALGAATALKVKPATASANATAVRGSVVPLQRHAATAASLASLSGAGTPIVTWAARAALSVTALAAGNAWATSNLGSCALPAQASGSASAVCDYAATSAATATIHGTTDGSQVNPGSAAAAATGVFTNILLARSNPSMVFGWTFAVGSGSALVAWQGQVEAATRGSLATTLATSHRGAVASPATVSSAVAALVAWQGAGTATASGSLATTLATSHRGLVDGTAEATATLDVKLLRLATVAANAGCTGVARGYTRDGIDAPASRSMGVPPEPRGLLVPYEERRMRVPA